ncbi:Iron-sulfur cluster assembly SufBD protein abci8 [Ranunculus cassubicifolius]
MASLLANGISSFSPHPEATTKSHSHLAFSPNPTTLRFPSLTKNPKFLKIRADSESAVLPQSESSKSSKSDEAINNFLKRDYKYGFVSDIESVNFIEKKNEPEWMLEFRLKSYEKFLKMKEPNWSDNRYPPINLQDMCYYSEPKKKPTLNSIEEADPELLMYFDRLGVPLTEQKRLANVAVDAVFDSVSIATTHRKELEKVGVIFCSILEAVKEYPDLVRKYLGRVVPSDDNYYAALNAAVFSDGSFCYIPKDTTCPMPISTYFRINAMETGQFERTLIIADERSVVEYLEGCTAPSYDKNQLHAAVVELYTAEDAEIKYSTVQNWYAGDQEGKGGIYNFVTKRGICSGARSNTKSKIRIRIWNYWLTPLLFHFLEIQFQKENSLPILAEFSLPLLADICVILGCFD